MKFTRSRLTTSPFSLPVPITRAGVGERERVVVLRVAAALSRVFDDLVGEHVERAAHEAHGAVGVAARAAPVDLRAPPVELRERVAVVVPARHLLERGRDRVQSVDARTALPGGLLGAV